NLVGHGIYCQRNGHAPGRNIEGLTAECVDYRYIAADRIGDIHLVRLMIYRNRDRLPAYRDSVGFPLPVNPCHAVITAIDDIYAVSGCISRKRDGALSGGKLGYGVAGSVDNSYRVAAEAGNIDFVCHRVYGYSYRL